MPSPRLVVESWDPSYGAPLAPDEALAPSEGQVDCDAEPGPWEPRPGEDDGVAQVCFVDGVRRIDARLAIPRADGMPIPGIAGSHAVGAVVWDRLGRRSEVDHIRTRRLAVFSSGAEAEVPGEPPVSFDVESEPSDDPDRLVARFHGSMRRAEAELIAELADHGAFVIGDGPVNDTRRREVVGYVKTHRVAYLPPERAGIVGQLAPGLRTPLFVLGAGGTFARWSWYQRLPLPEVRHAWSGVVRCEAPGSLPLVDAARLADRTAALLPLVAAPVHTDPRAPQNLVPIGALERRLRHALGDQRLVYRALLHAVEGAA